MYQIFGQNLDCDRPLPELLQIESDTADIRVSQMTSRHLPQSINWFHSWRDSAEQVSIRVGRDESYYYLQFPGLADFRIDLQAAKIDYLPAVDCNDETLRHLLIDQVVPRMLGQKGLLVLHASAVILGDGRALAFVGESGAGKSTLAAKLHQQSARLLADDCVMIHVKAGEVELRANYSGLRLYADSADTVMDKDYDYTWMSQYSYKRRLIDERLHQTQGAVPLAALFLLENLAERPTNEIALASVNGAADMISVIRQSFVMDVENKKNYTRQFHAIAGLVNSGLPIYRLAYSHRFSDLDNLQSTVLNAHVLCHS